MTQILSHREIFNPLHNMLVSGAIGVADILEVIGGFSGSKPEIGQAMAFHVRDYLKESGNTHPHWGHVMSEMYWRTFFSEQHAQIYGVSLMPPKEMEAFVGYMLSSSDMDAAVQDSLFPSPSEESARAH